MLRRFDAVYPLADAGGNSEPLEDASYGIKADAVNAARNRANEFAIAACIARKFAV